MTATDRTTLVQRLQEHTTIGSAPLPELEWLAAHGYLRRYAAGDFVIRTGTGGTPQARRVARRRGERHPRGSPRRVDAVERPVVAGDAADSDGGVRPVRNASRWVRVEPRLRIR